MGIQGLLRNLHPLLVPPPTHHSHNNNSSNDNGSSSNNNAQQHQQPPPQRNNPKIRHNIRQFQNKSLAIDASSWLHKAAYTCAERLVESTENGTRDATAERSYCAYMTKRCEELLTHAKIDKIYLVFDGIRVPLKSGTNADRESKRQANIREARRLMQCGRRQEASEKYRSCVKGNDTMARVVAAEVEKRWGKDDSGMDGSVRVKCVWSPYEADAQLAKLCVDGWAHAVVTEDSDVLVYSAVTRRPFPIIYKLDRKDGSCDVVTMDWLVNPAFLASLKGGNGNNTISSRRSRRRRERDRDLEYIYNDSPLEEDEEGKENTTHGQGSSGDGNGVEHPCEVEYDDMGFAPIRRALPLPTSASSGAKSGGRSKRRGSTGSSEGNASGNALLSYLRSFANKEASSPGAGVRLFVQACVLSGCDYVTNRLSKVGPVTAFKLVKEASHRDASIRFERILKSLPAGSKLIAEASDKSSEDGEDEDVDNDEEDDDFLSPPDTDRDAKEKYEELLSKSQAVFYYHLVKELNTGNIVPLIAHHRSSKNEREGTAGSTLEVDESFRPCIERFQPGLTFIGSATEALKKETGPLPAVASGPGRHSHRHAAMPQQSNNGGWMSTNRSGSNAGGQVRNNYQKSSHYRQPANPPVTAAPPKETALEKFLKGHQKKTTPTTRALGNRNNLMNVGMAKSAGGNVDKVGKPKEGAHHGDGPSAPIGKTNLLHKSASTSATSTNAPMQAKPNPFAAFTRPALKETELPKRKSPIPTFSSDRGTPKADMKSPLLSPVKFDYGGFTPPPGGSSKKKPNLKSDGDTDSSNAVAGKQSSRHFAKRSSDDDSVELLEDDEDEDEGEEQIKQPGTISTPLEYNAVGNSSFDYGIVPESPPIKAPAQPNSGALSTFIDQAKSGPRRVSTSPPEREKHNSNDVIDLSDDIADDDPDKADDVAASTSIVDENHPFPPKRKSSVNKQPFKSPYHSTTTTGRKGTVSSSALLAGFAKQKNTYSSTVNKKRKTSRFFPTKSTESSQSQKIAKSLPGKRPKGTPSLKNFYGSSDKDR